MSVVAAEQENAVHSPCFLIFINLFYNNHVLGYQPDVTVVITIS